MSGRLRWVASGVVVVASVVAVLVCGALVPAEDVETSAAVTDAREALQKAKDELNSVASVKTYKASDVAKIDSTMKDIANRMSDLQDEYMSIIEKSDFSTDDVKDVMNRIRELYADDVQDKPVLWFSEAATGRAGEIGWHPAKVVTYDTRNAILTWECLDEDGAMYAYALAYVNVDSGKITYSECHKTSLVSDLSSVEGADDGGLEPTSEAARYGQEINEMAQTVSDYLAEQGYGPIEQTEELADARAGAVAYKRMHDEAVKNGEEFDTGEDFKYVPDPLEVGPSTFDGMTREDLEYYKDSPHYEEWVKEWEELNGVSGEASDGQR